MDLNIISVGISILIPFITSVLVTNRMLTRLDTVVSSLERSVSAFYKSIDKLRDESHNIAISHASMTAKLDAVDARVRRLEDKVVNSA